MIKTQLLCTFSTKKDIENKLKKEEENKKLAEKKTQEALNTNSKRPAPNCIIIII